MNRRELLKNVLAVAVAAPPMLQAQEDKPAGGQALRLPLRVSQVLDLLKRTGAAPIALNSRDGRKWAILSPKLVGRVMCTGFDGLEGEAHGYANVEQLEKGFSYRGKGDWNNFGGIERIWFTPEGGKFGFFFLPGETQNWENYLIPAAMQETPFRLLGAPGNNSATFAAELGMTNYAGHKVDLAVRRQITLLEACPYAVGLGAKIRCVGFESRNWARNAGAQRLARGTTPFGIWTLGQYYSGPRTVILLPCREGSEADLGPQVMTEYLRYFLIRGDMPANQWTSRKGCVIIRADGKVQAKLEMLRRRALGRLASVNLDDLTMNIVTCDTYPELPYPASYNLPYDGDPLDGGVLSTYMNEGVPGDLAKPAVHELEVCSPLLELEPGEEFCHVSRSYQIRGEESAIDHICRTFFNVELSDLQRFAGRSQP